MIWRPVIRIRAIHLLRKFLTEKENFSDSKKPGSFSMSRPESCLQPVAPHTIDDMRQQSKNVLSDDRAEPTPARRSQWMFAPSP